MGHKYTAVTHFTVQCQSEIEVQDEGYTVTLRDATLKRTPGDTTVFIQRDQPVPDQQLLTSANQIIPKAMLLRMAQDLANEINQEEVEKVAPKLAKENLN